VSLPFLGPQTPPIPKPRFMEPGGFDQATSSPNVFSSFGHAGGTNGDSWFQKFNHDDVFVTPDHLYTVVPKEENDADFQCPMVVWAAV